MLSLRGQTVEDDLPWECEVQFENVDWNDILDAEESGDTEALQLLMNKSNKVQEQKEPITEVSQPITEVSPEPCLPSLSYAHVDWNDILDAEESGDTEALQLLMNKSNKVQEQKEPITEFSPEPWLPSLSYAQAVGSVYQGIKRTVSDRYNVSPLDQDPKRSAKYSRVTRGGDSSPFSEIQPMDHLAATPHTHSTPDLDSHHKKGSSAYVQRRLFNSPNSNEQPFTKTSPGQPLEKLTCHRLCQRQKQLDFGKNTIGYLRYIQTIPKWQRKPTDPVTPDKNRQSSTRAWQGQVRHWRRALHVYDDPEAQETFTTEEAVLCKI